MLTRFKNLDQNLDLFASLALWSTLAAELVMHLAANESLLAMLPPWVQTLVFAAAAGIRYRHEQRKLAASPEPETPSE